MLVPSVMAVMITLAAAVALAVTGFLLVRRGAAAEPSCGRCRYPVTGLTTFVCPECGADLRTVGILTDDFRPRLARRWRGVLWMLLLPVPALIISATLSQLVRIDTMTSRIHLNSPKSGAYRKFGVVERARSYSSGPSRLEEITILLTRLDGGAPITLEVDPKTLAHRYTDAGGRRLESAAPLDVAAVMNWMKAMGVSGDDEAITLEVDEVLALLKRDAAAMKARNDAHVSHNFNAPGGLAVRGDDSTPRWFIASAISFWVLIWLFGLWRILHRPLRNTKPVTYSGAT